MQAAPATRARQGNPAAAAAADDTPGWVVETLPLHHDRLFFFTKQT